MAAFAVRSACIALCVLTLAACSPSEKSARPMNFAKKILVEPHVGLWMECSGTGPTVLADGGLDTPTAAWARVRGEVRRVRLCAFDRAGVGRSDVRACRCGTLERDVEDVHALIRKAGLNRPVILAGHSTGGLDSLLYARTYPADVAGLVLVDSPSESAPAPPTGTLEDGRTRLNFASGLEALRQAGDLGDLPILILSHGERTFSTKEAERSWARMQRELSGDSSNTLRIVALDSRHFIQDDQPVLVAAAFDEAAAVFPKKRELRCLPAFRAERGRCVG